MTTTTITAADFIAPIMRAHLPSDWTWGWDRAKRRAGQANFTERRVTFSTVLMPYMTEQQITDTAYHEVAHVLAGSRAGHGPLWARQMRAFGVPAARTLNMEGQERPPAKYTGVCPNGHESRRERLTDKARRVSCSKCAPVYDARYKFTWTVTG